MAGQEVLRTGSDGKSSDDNRKGCRRHSPGSPPLMKLGPGKWVALPSIHKAGNSVGRGRMRRGIKLSIAGQTEGASGEAKRDVRAKEARTAARGGGARGKDRRAPGFHAISLKALIWIKRSSTRWEDGPLQGTLYPPWPRLIARSRSTGHGEEKFI